MQLPPPFIEQLSELAASNIPPSQLFEILSYYETDSLISAGNGDPDLLSFFYSTFFFSHLLTNQVPEARALTQRIPETFLHQDPCLQSCLNLLRAVWQKRHDQVYLILRQLSWSDKLQPLVRRYESFFQDQTLIAVSNSYGAINLPTAATYLGLDTTAAKQADPAIIKKFTDCGWKWEAETKLLHPTPIIIRSTESLRSNGIRDAMALLGN
ncbi:COP9 signalosome subunit CSN8 [Penicillium verhagenii]|nr:COP9 signalosome subunit CSN8 [Penicillium verhagenii]